MRILILTQGWYGERIAQHILKNKPEDWEVEVIKMTTSIPPVIDEPEDYIPGDIGDCQLLIVLSESPGTSSLIPDLAKASGAHSIIAPIDNSKWLPIGLKNSILESLSEDNIRAAFPKTFCTLDANTGDRLIDEFAMRFGKPYIDVSLEGDKIMEVKVIRGSPCGCTHFVAQKLSGLGIDEAELRAGLLFHNYPCLASMENDQEYGDSLLHVSGYAMKDVVKKALNRAKQLLGLRSA